MTAREWLRRAVDTVTGRTRLRAQLVVARARGEHLWTLLTDERRRARRAEEDRDRARRERDQWRLRARCTPEAAEDADRAARHAEAERTGGR